MEYKNISPGSLPDSLRGDASVVPSPEESLAPADVSLSPSPQQNAELSPSPPATEAAPVTEAPAPATEAAPAPAPTPPPAPAPTPAPPPSPAPAPAWTSPAPVKSQRQKTAKERALNVARQQARANLERHLGHKPKQADVFRLVSYRKRGMSDEEAFRKIRRPASTRKSQQKRHSAASAVGSETRKLKVRALVDKFVADILNA